MVEPELAPSSPVMLIPKDEVVPWGSEEAGRGGGGGNESRTVLKTALW